MMESILYNDIDTALDDLTNFDEFESDIAFATATPRVSHTGKQAKTNHKHHNKPPVKEEVKAGSAAPRSTYEVLDGTRPKQPGVSVFQRDPMTEELAVHVAKLTADNACMRKREKARRLGKR